VLTVIPPIALGPLSTLSTGWRSGIVLFATLITLMGIGFLRRLGTRIGSEVPE
jgi:hypothetical protein